MGKPDGAANAKPISFELAINFACPASTLWNELIDWKRHGDWVPLTRVVVSEADSNLFVARSGFAPFQAAPDPARAVNRFDLGFLFFDDRMRVTEMRQYSDAAVNGHCEIEKLGSFVGGEASFTVSRVSKSSSRLVWRERLIVRPYWLSRALRPLLEWLGRQAFTMAFKRLERTLKSR